MTQLTGAQLHLIDPLYGRRLNDSSPPPPPAPLLQWGVADREREEERKNGKTGRKTQCLLLGIFSKHVHHSLFSMPHDPGIQCTGDIYPTQQTQQTDTIPAHYLPRKAKVPGDQEKGAFHSKHSNTSEPEDKIQLISVNTVGLKNL